MIVEPAVRLPTGADFTIDNAGVCTIGVVTVVVTGVVIVVEVTEAVFTIWPASTSLCCTT